MTQARAAPDRGLPQGPAVREACAGRQDGRSLGQAAAAAAVVQHRAPSHLLLLRHAPPLYLSDDCGTVVCKYMLKACRKGRHLTVRAVADVAVALRRAKPEVAARLIDAASEETRRFLENPTFRDQQRSLVTARLLGELHNRALVPTLVVFEQLYEFVNFGHDVPDALKEASERQLKMEEEEEERRLEREKAVQNKDKDEGDHRNNSIALLK